MEKQILLGEAGEEKPQRISWRVLTQEAKRTAYIAGPMVAVNLSQYFLQIISIMMVGHLGQLSLSSTAIAISFCGVTGFSLLFGMSSALETLCGQAHGAKQYRQFGVQIYTAIFSLNIVCIPLSVLWIYMGKILVFMGQDTLISQQAAKFSSCLIPALFGYANLQAVVRYFQMQSLIFPLIISSLFAVCFHVVVCWILVFNSGLGNLGAAFSIGISYWVNWILLALYMRFSSSCEKTRVSVSMELFQGVGQFFRLAIPSAGMICLEWWSFEFLTMLSGILPNPRLETSVLSVCLATISTLYTVPDGLGAAARHVFGYIFSNEKEVVDYVTDMAPLVSISVILESFQVTLSGVARGCGWQNLGAYVNLVAYYICGIPVAAVLGFWLKFRGKGLWIGIQVGSFLQNVMLVIITSCTNWEEQARKARERVFERRSISEDGSE
ncbi:hypothetical protein MANES_06G063000v8 [Manihot esculenta]|uniref:Uncharacterized protein n=1 Tax=Manihot esculenta TaxID=3983 RepID=A0ACB7HKF9_MANES|nr:hypothetical protein MANES_06G063000v8 [Manihot esculenta]